MSAPITSPTPPSPVPGEIRASNAAPLRRIILAQTRAELFMALRQGERVLVTIIFPTVLLLFFVGIQFAPMPGVRAVDFLLPGMLAAAVMATGMVSLGIGTAYERYYGVLKRLGASPLPRAGLIAAKILSVLALEVGQVALLVLLATLFLGWHAHGSYLAALGVLLLGTLTFAGLGMLMAGALRAEATLAGANALFIIFLFIGGMVVPVDHLGFLSGLASILPGAAFSDALRGALNGPGVPAGSVLLLAVWGGVILAAAALTFKWE